MKGYTRERLEEGRPPHSALEAISFCLRQLYKEKTKTLNDDVVVGLTYEELIGALLLAHDLAEEEEGL